MFYAISHYRILKSIIKFGYKATGSDIDFSPSIEKELRVFMPWKTKFKHCCYMAKLGVVEISREIPRRVRITDNGIKYFLELKSSISSVVISVTATLLSLIIGFILGRIPLP